MMIGVLSICIVLYSFIGLSVYHFAKRIIKCFPHKVEKVTVHNKVIILTLLIVLPTLHLFSVWTLGVIHFIVLSYLIDGINFILHKVCNVRPPIFWKHVYQWGIVPLLASCLLLTYGSYNMHHVLQTTYSIETDKWI